MNNWGEFTDNYLGFSFMPMLDEDMIDLIDDLIEYITEENV